MAKERFQIKGSPFEYINRLIDAKKDFKVSITSASGKIQIGEKTVSFGSAWKMKTLGLYSKTNAYLSKRELPASPQKINYINLTSPEQALKVYDNVCSLDISAAYHSAAEILGYFNEDLKNAHLAAGKKERLQAFGATAKRSEEFIYVNGILTHEEPIENPNRPFFENCAMYVGDTLEEIKFRMGKEFIFYWVDCAFFIDTPENRAIAYEVFNAAGFVVHMENTQFMIYRRDEKKHTIERYKDGKQLVYNLPIYDVKKYEKRKFEARNKINRF